MSPVKLFKTALVACCAALGLVYTSSNSLSSPIDPDNQKKAQPTASAKSSPEDFVGSETCKACHEEQFASFRGDKMGRG